MRHARRRGAKANTIATALDHTFFGLGWPNVDSPVSQLRYLWDACNIGFSESECKLQKVSAELESIAKRGQLRQMRCGLKLVFNWA